MSGANSFCLLNHPNPDGLPTWLYIPGWATDSRLIAPEKWAVNWVLSDVGNPFTFVQDLVAYCGHSSGSIDRIVGFSMGATLACDTAVAMADNAALSLIGAHTGYSEAEIEPIRNLVRQNPAKALRVFYGACFSNQRDSDAFFATYWPVYQDQFSDERLMSGLDYLASARLKSDGLSDRCRFVHGTADQIAPIESIRDFASAHGVGLTEIDGCGHIPFLGHDMLDIVAS